MAGLNLHPHPGKCPALCSPLLVSPDPEHTVLVLFFVAGKRRPPLSRPVRGGAAVSAPEAGRPWDPGRGQPGGAGGEGCAPGPPWRTPPPQWEPRGRSQPQSPCGEAGIFKIWARKEQTSPASFGTPCPGSSSLSLGRCPCPRPWAPVPFPAPPLPRCGVSRPPRAPGVPGGWGPGPGPEPPAGGRRPSGDSSPPGKRSSRAQAPVGQQRPGLANPLCSREGARRGPEAGPPAPGQEAERPGGAAFHSGGGGRTRSGLRRFLEGLPGLVGGAAGGGWPRGRSGRGGESRALPPELPPASAGTGPSSRAASGLGARRPPGFAGGSPLPVQV